MNYSILTNELSKRAGIHKELFELCEEKTGNLNSINNLG